MSRLNENNKIKEKGKEVVVKVQDKEELNKEKEIREQSKDEEQVTESKVLEKEQHNIKSENYTNSIVEENLSNKQEVKRAEPLFIQKHLGKKSAKKKMKNSVISCEEEEDEPICRLTEGEYVLWEGETLIRSFTFCGDGINYVIN